MLFFNKQGAVSKICSDKRSLNATQAVAALTELAIPHFTTRTIFSVANLGSEAKFYMNVKILAVSLQVLSCQCSWSMCVHEVQHSGQNQFDFISQGLSPANLNSISWHTDSSVQVLSVSYGLFAGLRGFLISLLNTQLIQNLRQDLQTCQVFARNCGHPNQPIATLTCQP